MYSIYYNNKVINFRRKSDPIGINNYIIEPNEQIDITKVLQKVENNKEITLLSDDVEQLLAQFCSFLRVAEAAGGLVRNNSGRALMIFRNGRWDLPKGHREPGESLETCALREVTEECGIDGLELGVEICLTMHIYPLGDELILKKCHWYSMRYNGNEQTTPQTEEGIESVEWLGGVQVYKALENSYETIKDVFKQEKTYNNGI